MIAENEIAEKITLNMIIDDCNSTKQRQTKPKVSSFYILFGNIYFFLRETIFT